MAWLSLGKGKGLLVGSAMLEAGLGAARPGQSLAKKKRQPVQAALPARGLPWAQTQQIHAQQTGFLHSSRPQGVTSLDAPPLPRPGA